MMEKGISTEIHYSTAINPISDKEFSRLRTLIYAKCGINITDAKRTMLEARLQKRLKKLSFRSFSQYCEYLASSKGMEEELTAMINQVTTNKTDFFREPAHFDWLQSRVLPGLGRVGRPIRVWSAGCSSGEEAYTLAMVLKEFGRPFEILATDISTKVLDKARLAIYDEERVRPIPPELIKRYMLVSRDRTRRLYRVAPELRKHVRFATLNFMDDDFGFEEAMDIIFCRNVIIYFDKATQERLLRKLCNHLSRDGYVFMGHSETLLGMDVPLLSVAPTIYRMVG